MLAIAILALVPLIVDSAGAASSVVSRIAHDVHRATGREIVIHTGTVGQIRRRLAAGERADIVILSASALKTLSSHGAIVAGTQTPLGASPMAVGVRAGAPLPDVSTTAAFKRTLLRATAIAATDPAAGASSGIYFAKLLRRLGIADAIGPKERLTPGGHSCDLVVQHRADLCVQNVTEIVPVKGVSVAGLLPPEIQNVIVYSAGVLSRSSQPAAARAFVRELSAPRYAPLWRRAGFRAVTSP